MQDKMRIWAGAAALAVGAGLLTAAPAWAEPVPDTPTLDESVNAIDEVVPEVLEDVHEDIQVSENLAQASYETETGDSRLIELDAAAGDMTVESVSEGSVTLSLVTEAATDVQDATLTDDGALYAEHVEGVSSTAYIKDGASVQVLSTIAGPGADSRIPFEFSAPGLASIQDIEGALVLLDSAGEMLGGVGQPWAKDANGVDVPTRYEIDGLSITQVVDHATGDFAYPIVADPIWGTNLFTSVDPGYNKHVLKPSAWGRHVQHTGLTDDPSYVNQRAQGARLMLSYGWEEFKQRSTIPQFIFPTVLQQYKCHAIYAQEDWIGGPTWDLEVTRPVVSPDYIAFQQPWLWNHQCNWNHTNGTK